MSDFSHGSQWNKWDLHFHTPSSYDYQHKGATNQDIVDGLTNSGIRVVAITDHHVIDVARIRALQKLGGDNLTVLPGIELRSDLGGHSSVHFIGIFPPDCDLEDVWTKLSARCEITPADVQKVGDDRVYCQFANAARTIIELGGLVTVHGHGKSNSIEEIANFPPFKQQVKTDLLRECVDIVEVGSAPRQADYRDIVFKAINIDLPIVVGSDNHDIRKYSCPCCCWIRADPTFQGLLMTLREPVGRVFLGERPPELDRFDGNKTKYIRSISFTRKASCPDGHQWFTGEVPLNPGLVAIVGNKGSGKSALADSLGLVGATRNGGSFSFLCRDRFLHPVSGVAGHFEAVVTWQSGEMKAKVLAESVNLEEPERVRYLPQAHVETVCNELGEPGQQSFESELKAVIFSHVPEELRLGQSNLDELVRFRTGEKQNRIDALASQLKDLSRHRSVLEMQSDPSVQRNLLERIELRRLELQTHIEAKPAEVTKPTTDSAPESSLLATLTTIDQRRTELQQRIDSLVQRNRDSQLRRAIAERLTERLENFKKELAVFHDAIAQDSTALGLSATDLVVATVNVEQVRAVERACTEHIRAAEEELDSIEPPGLRQQLADAEAEVANIRGQLDAPNQAYQAYVAQLREWEERRKVLEGDGNQPESLFGMLAAAAEFQKLPQAITEQRDKQIEIALQILDEKVAQAEVYKTHYGPVQSFIDSHEIAKNRLQLEFRAELASEGFTDRLLTHIAQNRRGSFMGVDEGRARADQLVEVVDWNDREIVRNFLLEVDNALHTDKRSSDGQAVLVKDQLGKNRRMEDLFDAIYGMEYVSPRYVLRWEGKELSMLSPGERGALLLVFYLLIDRSDVPLIIDQPEGNLDNHTVAKMLVDCIREAKQRRQVVIVTHNPNLAVVCDADQIIHVAMDKGDGHRITYKCGSLENPEMIHFVTEVLEGTRWAFDVRGSKYDVSKLRTRKLLA